MEKEAYMKKEAIKRWIDEVYENLCALLSMYEETDCFRIMQEREEDEDHGEFVRRKIRELYYSVIHYTAYMDEQDISESIQITPNFVFPNDEIMRVMNKLEQIVSDAVSFVTDRYLPIALRWEFANRQLIYFDEVFDLMEEYPEDYKEILVERKLQRELELRDMRMLRTDGEIIEALRASFAADPTPDEKLIVERNAYFEKIRERNEKENVTWSKKRIFQEELLNTMKLLFEEDFKEYLWTEKEVENMVKRFAEILSEYTKKEVADIKPELDLILDLDLTAIDLVEIVAIFGREFKVAVSDRDIVRLRTVGDIERLIAARGRF